MEATKAAAVSLFRFAIQTTVGDNYPPQYTHYLPLRMTGRDGQLKPMIQVLTPRAGSTASPSSAKGENMFLIKNEWNVDAGPNGGIQAYVTPNEYDMCPETSAYYPVNAQVKATIYNEEWIEIIGKIEVPNDIREKQALAYAHAIPYWQECQQQLQYTRDVEEASKVQAQRALQDVPFAGPTAGTPLQSSMRGLDTIAGAVTPPLCGPIGLPPLTDVTGMPIRHHIGTPQHSPGKAADGRHTSANAIDQTNGVATFSVLHGQKTKVGHFMYDQSRIRGTSQFYKCLGSPIQIYVRRRQAKARF